MLNLITFLQTISDSDYGYNFLVLKFWNSDMHFACQWYYYYHLTHIKPGMFLSKNYFCKKKMGQKGCIQCMSRARKSHDGIQPYKIQDRKKARRKNEKNGGQGHSQDFFKGVEGGGHTVSNRGYSPFFCYLNILACLFKKGSIRGSKAPISLPPPPP